MAFEKGHKKIGGRQKGTGNKTTESIKILLNTLLSEEELVKLWKHHLEHKNPHIRFETFKLANHYLFGKPVQPVVGEELRRRSRSTSARSRNIVNVSRVDVLS